MNRVLISRLSALGDVVCTLPAAVALKGSFPDVKIVWVVDPRFAGIVECCEAVDEVLKVKPGFDPKTWPRFDAAFDAALDMQGLLKSAIVVARAKADVKLGYHWQREGSWLFSAAVQPDPTSLHIVDQYVDVARALGAQMDRAEFKLKPKGEDVEAVRTLLAENGIADRYAVLNAGAGWATKRWPPEAFAALAHGLAANGVRSVLIGGKADADREAANQVLAESAKLSGEPPIDFLGKTSVRELVALVGGAKVHVAGDTGSTHIAAALGVPAVGLYSITRPERSCPYGQFDRCHYEPNGLAGIASEDVLRTAQEAIA